MTRTGLAGKRVVVFLGLALAVLAAPRVATAQEAQADPLKFATSKPVIVGWVIKADKATEFEEGWTSIRALLAKSDKDDMKAFGQSMADLYRVDQAPFDMQGSKAVIYIFRIDAPSTAYSYNPREILYVYLKAGQEGSAVTRAEADGIYGKLQAAYLTINPLWTLIKIGG